MKFNTIKSGFMLTLCILSLTGYSQNSDKMNISMARVAIENNDFESAQKYLSGISEEAKRNSDYLQLTAKISLHLKDYQSTLNVYNKLYELTGNDTLFDAIARVNYLIETNQKKADGEVVFNDLMRECPKYFNTNTTAMKISKTVKFNLSDGKILKLNFRTSQAYNEFQRKFGKYLIYPQFEFEFNSKPFKVCLYSNKSNVIYYTTDGNNANNFMTQIDHKKCHQSWSTTYPSSKWRGSSHPIANETYGRGTDSKLGGEVDKEIFLKSYMSSNRIKSIEFKSDEYNETGTISTEDAETLHKICHCLVFGDRW